MIVRIAGEGQYIIADDVATRLNALDADLLVALDGADELAFAGILERMLALVRTDGRPAPLDDLAASDAILPSADTSLANVRALIGEMGLIPD